MAAHPGRIASINILLVAVGFAAHMSAHAGENGLYGFVGAGIGYWDTGDNSLRGTLDNLGGGTGVAERIDRSIKLGLGYQFNAYNAIDIAYHDNGRYKMQLQTVSDGRVNFDVKVRRVAASYILNIPATENLSVTGRVGISRWSEKIRGDFIDQGISASETRNDTDALWGLGLRYRMSPSVSLAIEYETFHQQEDNLYWDFGALTSAVLVKF